MRAIEWKLARRARAIVAECNEAQRRLWELRQDPERYVFEPDGAPDTYQIFLIRSSWPLVHEPSAFARSLGLTVR
jgi:hypothetical protein